MRLLAFLAVLFLVGCSTVTAPNKEQWQLTTDSQSSVTRLQQEIDQLPSGLGDPDYQRSMVVSKGSLSILLIPLEAEDERRFLILISRPQQQPIITALGLAQTTWFSSSRAETLSTYEGWIFLYNLTDGQRSISSYFEGQTLLFKELSYLGSGLSYDPLTDDRKFSCLALELSSIPVYLKTNILLPTTDSQAVALQLANQLELWLACLAS